MKISSIKQCFLIATALIISACVNTPISSQRSCQADKLESREPNVEPEWARVRLYSEDKDYEYFTGRSGEHRKKKSAQSKAEHEARMAFVRRTGIRQSILDEYSRVSSGLSSGVIDEAVNYRNTHKQFAEAFFRNSKVKSFYVERYSRCKDGFITGSYYEAFVQVQVPKSEYEAVQEWRAEQERKEQEERANQVRILAASVDEANKLAASSQLLAALRLLHSIRNDKDHASRAERSGEVQRARRLHSELLAGLRLELISDAEQSLQIGADAEPVRALVWFIYRGQRLTAVDIPLMLLDSVGNFHGNQRSNKQGEVQLHWDFGNYAPGVHEAYLSLDMASMVEAANENELDDLRARGLRLRASVEDDLFAEQYWPEDFDFNLRFAPAQPNAWRANTPVEVLARCNPRCYIDIYGWDEREQRGQLLLSSRRRLARGQEAQIGSVRFGVGSYRLIALAYTEKINADMQLNTSFSRDDLSLLLKQMRAGIFSKAERHWLINAS